MPASGVFRLTLLLLALAPAAVAQPTEQPAAPSTAEPLIEPVLPVDAEFARNIALIRADLLMADDLVKERDWVDARPHVDFPREEIYGVIRDQLRAYKTPPFDGALRELAHAVAARSIRRYERAKRKVQAALVDADFALRARQKDWSRFTLQVAAAILRDAADEYDDAAANGRIVHAVGYQTARGIVFESDRMIESVAKDVALRNSASLQSLRGNMMRLKDVFATVSAPKAPRADPQTVRKLITDAGAVVRSIR